MYTSEIHYKHKARILFNSFYLAERRQVILLMYYQTNEIPFIEL